LTTQAYGVVPANELEPWSPTVPAPAWRVPEKLIEDATKWHESIMADEEEQLVECSACAKARRIRGADALAEGKFWTCAEGFCYGGGKSVRRGCDVRYLTH
jgi:hypothetical protein